MAVPDKLLLSSHCRFRRAAGFGKGAASSWRKVHLLWKVHFMNEQAKSKISVQDLHLYYGQFHALKGITMEIPEHEITALIGPSGCGKSTFLKTLNRMNDLEPNVRIEGSVRLDGADIYQDMDAIELRKRVGMVFQQPNPFPKSIFENVASGTRRNWRKSASAVSVRQPSGMNSRTVLANPRSVSPEDSSRDCVSREPLRWNPRSS